MAGMAAKKEETPQGDTYMAEKAAKKEEII